MSSYLEQNLSFYTVPAAFALVMVPHAYGVALAGRNYDLANPRATEENALKDARITKPTLQRIKRARAATANGFETLALFAAGVVAANSAHVGLGELNRLTLGYLAARTAYNFSYIVLQDNARLAVFRSVSWISSLYCIFSLFVKAGNAVN
ncbi:hypothetical protein B0T18DRAFT_434226 [Schizothecium vesticola]|uniref:Uncharacterized protein n=1 Tax=Schizothecium vesticola TaxID=314040 RepID=A0AA40F9E9_9PEZI|nr:hypothetical protein B0T18DRAFT_434226 [Schizothecium vesticola]